MQAGNWVALIAQVNCERKAYINAQNQGFDAYWPRIREASVVAGRITYRERALFPRYQFVKVFTTWRPLLSTLGVFGLVMNGQRPAYVPNNEIELLRSRQIDGYIVLPKPPPQYTIGQLLQINEGPMTGFAGLFDGMAADDRVRILLDMLGGKTPVVIAERAVTAQ